MTVSLGDFIHNEREPDNLFKKMFTGQHPCYQTQCSTFNSDPVYFIDCDPIVFKHILEWLQYGAIAIELSNDVKRSLLNTCKKFELKNIINELENEESTRLNLKNFVNLHKIQKRSLNFKYYNFNNLSACDFSGMNLESSNFKMLILKGCDFSNCNLTNANFIECDMIECNLSNSILNNTNISKSNLSRAKIDVCELIQKVDFSRCNLSNICFKQFKFDNVIFTNSIIDGSKFEDITFEKCKIKTHFKKNNGLINCKYIECDFTGTIFEEIDFKLIEPSLSTTLFNNCTFKNSDLGKLKDLSKFKGSKFDSCLINLKQFTNKNIKNIQFQNITLNLTGKDFQSFKFTDVLFTQCTNITHFLISNIINSESISLEISSHTNSKAIPQLLYRGSRDGFKAENFHSKCCNQGPTLTIIKSAEHNQIFGAFTSKSWMKDSFTDDLAFIFKIDSTNNNYQFKKFRVKKGCYAISLLEDFMPGFGGYTLVSNDITIFNDCNLNYFSSSNFGNAYELPKGYKKGTTEANSYLAGSEMFKVEEIEVFKIIL
ncbi:predicted protein [Naegleria gruberi]|uniref:Predicted protein n=1 Tax=Naegleria gruberi TaxID=5762 RepID=D2VQJ8_NAEGR|nr:uncharacterized protein NAEGRDRAFT_71251 [Naegleria gruberi]EFC40961.1 predicted protein [Naegleria gruberi]|eukprot:XP_002673705.1 predicted protein [Naegleria gruberi strain NEG-M]